MSSLNKILESIVMEVTYNASTHQSQGISLVWVKTNKLKVYSRQKAWTRGDREMWPNARETAYCWGPWLDAGVVSIFLSGLAWHRHQLFPRHNRSYSMRETQRETSGWGGVEVVWRLSLPWSPMAVLTIQQPPQLSSHPQLERQSLSPGLLEQHGH